jgi:hypothetical protein
MYHLAKRLVFSSALSDVRPWKVMSRAIDVHHDQLGGACGTHDAANPCQTSTDTEYRCFSVVPCQVVNWRLLAVVSWHALEA